MQEEVAAALPDGRRQRSERSRQAILAAMLELVEEGVLVPTAQQVSERAGVGIRTVFRHFSDMESLFALLDVEIRNKYQDLFAGGDRNGSFDERLLHAVEQRALAYEATGNQFLSTQAQMWRYPTLQEQYARTLRQIRRDLEDWLPEIQALPAEQREMIDVAASFDTWHRLRVYLGLSVAESARRVVTLLRRIVVDDPQQTGDSHSPDSQ